MNVLSEQVKRFWPNMFLLEEASLLELNQSEGVSNEKLVENFWVFFFFFYMVKNLLEVPAAVLAWKADERKRCRWSPSITLRNAGDAHAGRASPDSSAAHRRLPRTPSRDLSQERKAILAPGASIKPVLRQLNLPRNPAAQPGLGRPCRPGAAGCACEASVTRRKPRGAAAMPFRRAALSRRSQLARASTWGPAGKRKNKAGEEDSQAAERGEEEEGLLLFAVASFVPKFLPQWAACLRRQLWPGSTRISCLIFLRASPPPARQSDPGHGDATLLGKSQPPSEAVFRSAALES